MPVALRHGTNKMIRSDGRYVHNMNRYDAENRLRREVTGDMWDKIQDLIREVEDETEERVRDEVLESVQEAAEENFLPMISEHNKQASVSELHRQFIKKLIHFSVLQGEWLDRARKLVKVGVGMNSEQTYEALEKWKEDLRFYLNLK